MNNKVALLSIIGYARGGAVDHAWRLLQKGGYDTLTDDSAVLCVVGRLLKDRASAATGAARQALYLQAADAYSRASALGGAAYPLINAATLSLLAGHIGQSRVLATQVLERWSDGSDEAETPYYRAATRAEAYLLLGMHEQAKTCLVEAVACAPQAYEDHASTIRQFALILVAQGLDTAWLDECRPPRCLHFAGHMDLPTDDVALREQIGTFLKVERVGFGFGALAAGADIVIAEALLEAGVDLHVILPTEPGRFCENSVVPFGRGWATRFEDALRCASSIVIVDEGDHRLSPSMLQLASEVAMGAAIMHAEVLATEPLQFTILDCDQSKYATPGNSHWARTFWRKAGYRQRAVIVPRTTEEAYDERSGSVESIEQLAAIVRFEWPNAEVDPKSNDVAARLSSIISNSDATLLPSRWTGETVVAAFRTPEAAAQVIMSAISELADVVSIRVAAHYGLAERRNDPFGGGTILTGAAAALPRQIMLSTPPKTAYVSEAFAAALYIRATAHSYVCGFIGDLPNSPDDRPIRLFALSDGSFSK